MSGTTIAVNGAVVQDRDITGTLTVTGQNVTIRRCRLTNNSGSTPYGIRINGGSAVIEDCEIIGYQNGIAFSNYVARRVEVRGSSQDGMKIGSNCLIENCWIHDLIPSPGAHADAMQAEGGTLNLIVRGCNIDPSNNDEYGNAAIILKKDNAGDSAGPVLIERNLLGGGNYTLFALPGNLGAVTQNATITGNRWKANARYGPRSVSMPVTWTSNTWQDSGLAINL